METKYVSIVKLKDLFISLALQLSAIVVVVSESDLRRVLNVEWLATSEGSCVKVQVSDNAGLPSSEYRVKNIIELNTKEEMIKFFTDLRMMRLEPFTRF